MQNQFPLLHQEWKPSIPRYNTRYIRTLAKEHQHFWIKGKLHKKGMTFNKSFAVTRTPDHFYDPKYHPKVTSEQEAKAKALAYIEEVITQENILVYQWGSNHTDPNKVTAVVVKMRYLALVSMDEEIVFLNKLRERKYINLVPLYPERLREFSKKQKKEINNQTGKVSFWKDLKIQINKYIHIDFKHPFNK